MGRGLYKLDVSVTPYPPVDDEGAEQPFGDVVKISRGTKWCYLYSGLNPHADLEALGATLVASSWREAAKALNATERGKVFDAEWEEEEEDPETKETRKVMRRGKVKDKPGGVSAKPPKLRELLIPIAFGERELAMEQRGLNKE